ncbi:hypothetical protein C0995_004718 [Termitomyces sp. Mi166|nr:hypothetical protein C0995_004718 [Termitomyces sp. Mi166\
MSIRVASDDLNPRPTKRLRHSSSPCPPAPHLEKSSPHVPSHCSPPLRRIPPDILLLSLPALILHPPTHRMHLQSLALARHALRRCLALPSLEPAKECRAWTGIAELGLMWLDSGASGLAMGEVEQALTKALTISQRHPALRLYTPHLMILSARLAQRHQNNSKFAISALRRLLTSFASKSALSTPPHILFGAHLELIHCLACAAEEESATSPSISTSTGTSTSTGLGKCLVAIQAMRTAAESIEPVGRPNVVVLLSTVIKLQLLVRHGVWALVGDALVDAEKAFEAFETSVQAHSSPHTDARESVPDESAVRASSSQLDPIPGTLRTHFLMLSVLFHTYAGDAQAATTRLRSLHELLDTGILEPKSPPDDAQIDPLDGWNEGVIDIPLLDASTSTDTILTWTPPLRIRTTPPRVLHALAFLLSAAAKRDAVGRAPKKGVFARAGLELRELVGPFGGTGEGVRLARIKADLMCELVSISTMRSDFSLSQSTLDILTSHLRAHALFDAYAARVTLMHAQLAHARGEVGRARMCYAVARYVAQERRGGGGAGGETDEWVGCAARAGEVWVRIGEARVGGAGQEGGDAEGEREMEELRREGEKVARECEGRGAALKAVGELLRACLAEEILKGKQHLRRALDLATRAQDNHLRALILALSASHYLHTAREHALTMLGTCGQLAAGLGAAAKGTKSSESQSQSQSLRSNSQEGSGEKGAGEKVAGDKNAENRKGKEKAGTMMSGNIPLSLWVGERMAELWRLEGEVGKAERQEGVNERMRGVVEAWRGR